MSSLLRNTSESQSQQQQPAVDGSASSPGHKDYAESVRLLGEPLPTTPDPSGVYLFTSFDLVNSTAYKSVSKTWPVAVRSFYDNAISEYKDKIEEIDTVVWKYQGDEILFHSRITARNQLGVLVDRAFDAVAALRAFVENLSDNRLSVKGACWLAHARYQPPEELRRAAEDPPADAPENLMFPVSSGGEARAFDFLGPEIDAGFRLSFHSAKRLLVVSAELAWLLSGHVGAEFPQRLRFLGLRKLKGVWSGRHYPLVLYQREGIALSSLFAYDDGEDSETIGAAMHAQPANPPTLQRILEEAGRMERAQALLAAIQPVQHSSTVHATLTDELEVHCVAVCFDAGGRALVARRPPGKQVAPGQWEFGCARLRSGQAFADAIRADYLGDFGLHVEVIGSKPIDTYTINKGRSVPGIIFAATAKNPAAAATSFSRAKHTEIRWISPTEANSLATASPGCVPDFLKNLVDAATVWRSRAVPGPASGTSNVAGTETVAVRARAPRRKPRKKGVRQRR